MNELAVRFLSRLGWASVYLAGAGALAYVVLRLSRMRAPKLHAATWWVVLLHGLLLFQVTLTIPWYEPSEPPADTGQPPVPLVPAASSGVVPAAPAAPASPTAIRPNPVVAAAPRPIVIPWPILMVFVWSAGVVAVAARWIWDYASLLRACRSRPCDRRDWQEEWNGLLHKAGVDKGAIPLHLGFGVGPALCRHWTGYRLIVPVRLWRRLSCEQRECVLRHELAHYLRGDVWSQLLARLLATLHWFNPVGWYAVGAIELASEYACDDFARRGERARADYARTLLTIGELARRTPAWTTAGGGGCLFKRISRVLSNSQAKDTGVKKTLVLVAILLAAAATVVRVELVAQEAPRRSATIEPFETTASVVTRIRELAQPAPIAFDEIEAIAAEATEPRRGGTFDGSRQAGPVYAEVATAYHRHGIPARTMVWAQAALRQDLKPLDRLRMFRYWAEADDLVHEQGNPPLMRPAAWGLLEASHFRIPVDGFSKSSGSQEEGDSTLLEHRNELEEHRDALVRLVTKESKELALEVKRFLLSPGLKGADRTPGWLAEGRAMACTYRIDPAILLNDLRPVFDAWVGEQGAFDDVIEGLKEDRHGPQVDVKREVFPYLGPRITFVTDYREPTLAQGTCSLVAIEVTDSEHFATVCDRLWESEPNGHQVMEGGVKIWVLEPGEGRPFRAAVCVAHGFWMNGDFELLRETLSRAE